MSNDRAHLLEELRTAALGGRVRSSPFLSEADASALRHALRGHGVACEADGGLPAAARRIVTARPDGVPTAHVVLTAVGVARPIEPEALRAALLSQGLNEGSLGDCMVTARGAACILRESDLAAVPEELPIAGERPQLARWLLDDLPQGRERTMDRVVASLRADVIGAAAFGASRTWFGKGIQSGRVRVDGVTVGKAATLDEGSELWAEGLGRATLRATHGMTKRGNVRVTLHVETPAAKR